MGASSFRGDEFIRSSAEGRFTTTEEPSADVEETIGGYFVVEVEDGDEAVEAAKNLPRGETIEVRPVV